MVSTHSIPYRLVRPNQWLLRHVVASAFALLITVCSSNAFCQSSQAGSALGKDTRANNGTRKGSNTSATDKPKGWNPDTLRVLDLAQVYELVAAFHPLARQADLINSSVDRELQMARGGFDPKLAVDYGNKE